MGMSFHLFLSPDRPFFGPVIRFPHLCVPRPKGAQLLVRTRFGYHSLIHVQDAVCIGDCTLTEGDDQYRFTFCQMRKGVQYLAFVFRIGKSGGFIQQNYRRIFQDGTSQGDTLRLTT